MSIPKHLKEHAILGIPSNAGNFFATKKPTIAYIGDSITALGNGYVKFPTSSPASWLEIAGSRSWTMVITPSAVANIEFRVADSSIRYRAPNDATWGAWTALRDGLNKLESGTAGLELLVGVKMDALPVIDTAYTSTQTNTSAWSSTCVGYFNHAQILSGQLLDVVSIQGIPGDTSANLLARLGDIWLYDGYLNTISARPDYVLVEIGTNDVFLIQRTASAINADIDSIVSTIKGNGSIPILMTITARNSATTPLFAVMQEVNRHIVSIGKNDSSVIVIDAFGATRDPAVLTGAAITNYLIDLAHLTNLGAYRVGKTIADTLVAKIGGGVKGKSVNNFGGDTSNFYTNNALIGTAGTAGTGVTGTVPTNLTVNRSGSTLATVVSVEAVANELPWVVLTSSGATAGDIAQALLTSRVLCSASVAAGAAIIGEVEFSASAFTALRRLDLYIECYNGSGSKYIICNKLYGSTESSYSIPDTTVTGILRTPLGATLPPDTVSFNLYCQAVYGTAGGGVVKFRNMTLKAG